MGDPGDQAKGLNDLAMEAGDCDRVWRVRREGAGAEDATLVHGLHGWLAVLIRGTEEYIAVPGDSFCMEDIAGDEALKDIVGLEVSQGLKDWPKLVRSVNEFDADGGGIGARLQEPRAGHLLQARRSE